METSPATRQVDRMVSGDFIPLLLFIPNQVMKERLHNRVVVIEQNRVEHGGV